MMTLNEVRQICCQLAMENEGSADDTLCDDVDSITYYCDKIDCDDTMIVNRHIDIEYSFGDYYEIAEDTPLFLSPWMAKTPRRAGRDCGRCTDNSRASHDLCYKYNSIPDCRA